MSDTGFQRRLGLFDATMLVAGSMIGSGIFIVSAGIARDVGSAGWLLVAWVVAGVMTMLGALAYAELAAMMPHAGGQYVYLREAYSPLFGFLYGWTSFLVIQTGTVAAVAVAFAKFLGVLVPALGTSGDAALLYRVPDLNWRLTLPLPWAAKPMVVFERADFTVYAGQLVAVGLVFALSLWNCLGVREGKWLQNVFTVAKIAALALLIGVGLSVAADPAVLKANFAEPFAGISGTRQFEQVAAVAPAGSPALLVAWMVLGGALVGSLFSSDAWNNVTFTAGEVKDPARTLPLSLVLGTGLVTGLYLLANLAYLTSLPLTEIANAPADRVGTAVITRALPGAGTVLMALAIMVSTFGCMNGMILMGARLYYAMARDGLFFSAVGRLNARGVPQAGLLAQAAWTSLLIFSGTYSDLLDYVISAALVFYALTVAGLFVLRRTRPDAERPYRALGYPVLPALYVVMCVLVTLNLLVVKPVYTWPGFLLVLAGVPVYGLWRLTKPAAT
jgi:APA family basic amino acid/polyamine antiporter